MIQASQTNPLLRQWALEPHHFEVGFSMCPGLLKEKDTVWNLIRPQHYTEFSYLPSPATNNDTTTGTSTTGDVVMIGYIQ